MWLQSYSILGDEDKYNRDYTGGQWLRLDTPNAGGLGSVQWETRSHMLQLKSSLATTKRSRMQQ